MLFQYMSQTHMNMSLERMKIKFKICEVKTLKGDLKI